MTDHRSRISEASATHGQVVELIEIHARAVPTESRLILDLGCGFSHIADACRELGFSYVGVDRDPDAVKDLRAREFEAHELTLTADDDPLRRLADVVGDRTVAAVLLINVLETMADGGAILDALRTLSSNHDSAPLIMSVRNVTHFDIAAKLLQGQWNSPAIGTRGDTQVGFFSAQSLHSATRSAGWYQIADSDVCQKESDEHFHNDNVALTTGTPVNGLLRRLRESSATGADTVHLVRAYVPGPIAKSEVENVATIDDPPPFLSILTRTQGERLDTLQEALLCLAAQSCDDFEVLLLAHNVSLDQAEDIRKLCDSFPPATAARFNLIQVTGAGRSTPLNAGIAAARGQYVAVLDDDDLVTGDWVEQFRELAEHSPGKVLRTVVARRDISSESDDGRSGYRTIGGLVKPYPADFDLFDHFVGNRSPICGLAFPRSCFRDFGIQFDQSLQVLEDWDVLLQSSLLCGVAASPSVTSIYRGWAAGVNSVSVHSKSEWDSAERAVIGKLDRVASILPPGAISQLRESLTARSEIEELRDNLRQAEDRVAELRASTSWRITAPLRLMVEAKRSASRRLGRRTETNAPTAIGTIRPSGRNVNA